MQVIDNGYTVYQVLGAKDLLYSGSGNFKNGHEQAISLFFYIKRGRGYLRHQGATWHMCLNT